VSALEVGQVVAATTYAISRDTLVRYAGASGDFNPIHYRDDVAASVGLPGVLAHGMLTMGTAVQPVVEWLEGSGDDSGVLGWVSSYQVRFTRPVVVDPVDGAEISVTATIARLDDEARTARVDLTVIHAEKTVLGRAQVGVTLA
jgi:acyl dehydratase